MPARVVRLAAAALLSATMLGGLASGVQASTAGVFECVPVAQVQRLVCVGAGRFTGVSSLSVFASSLRDGSNAYGVGVVCTHGQYALVYQTGTSRSFHYQPLAKLGNC